ncbi:hypothetical protein [Burkholderia sp. Tr-20390]|uniref:hypothetical protein n=1 Tax=Burkholderia sp. Tr-20390 TaxID=2703904 RepID=UPI001980FF93|nr:hypothetical protein [Burkholderia sp. Tr-20390]MBN3736878.1 hypothetical protein [Burkholderia sp. Tr-20390]
MLEQPPQLLELHELDELHELELLLSPAPESNEPLDPPVCKATGGGAISTFECAAHTVPEIGRAQA